MFDRHPGDYGKSLIILLSGSAEIDRNDTEQSALGPDGVERESANELITHEDHEPVIGFAACLGKLQWERVRNNTQNWCVVGKTYVDTAWVARKDVTRLFEAVWPTGQAQMEEVAFYHYEVSETQRSSPRFLKQVSPNCRPEAPRPLAAS